MTSFQNKSVEHEYISGRFHTSPETYSLKQQQLQDAFRGITRHHYLGRNTIVDGSDPFVSCNEISQKIMLLYFLMVHTYRIVQR